MLGHLVTKMNLCLYLNHIINQDLSKSLTLSHITSSHHSSPTTLKLTYTHNILDLIVSPHHHLHSPPPHQLIEMGQGRLRFLCSGQGFSVTTIWSWRARHTLLVGLRHYTWHVSQPLISGTQHFNLTFWEDLSHSMKCYIFSKRFFLGSFAYLVESMDLHTLEMRLSLVLRPGDMVLSAGFQIIQLVCAHPQDFMDGRQNIIESPVFMIRL